MAEQVPEMPVQELKPKSGAKKIVLILVFVLLGLLLIGGGVAAYFYLTREEPTTNTNTNANINTVVEEEEEETPSEVTGSKFAEYKQVDVDDTASVASYPIEEDLSNVLYSGDFYFSDDMKAKLAENGFVVVNSYWEEYFKLYEDNRYKTVPNFVTTDAMLHNYHLMFNYILEKVEVSKLSVELNKLNEGMLAQAEKDYDALKGTEWENAAKRNVAFFAVGTKLFSPGAEIPSYVQDAVEQELDLIAAHAGLKESPVMNLGADLSDQMETPQGSLSVDALKEDYTQYIPRGHYDKSELLQSYFKSMMWYGRLTFRFKSDDELRSALLITRAIDQGENKTHWDNIYEPTNFFVGASDDVTYYQLSDARDVVYGKKADLETVTDTAKFAEFKTEAAKIATPKINSIPVFASSIQPDREKEIKGFRFMGQRYTVDADIFQRLVCREVGNKSGTMDCPTADARMLPMGLDIPSALGSEEAYAILDDLGETDYKNYPENMAKLNTYVAEMDEDVWTQNLYWGWMYALRPLLEERGEGYPGFMQNNAWVRKGLNAFLGSWTELKHDTILYAKQVYAELGAGMDEEKPDDRGYVEPNPEVYARLAALLAMTSEGLEARGLLETDVKENLALMETLALDLKTISEKELQEKALTDAEYELIRTFGGQLEHIWIQVNKADYEAAGKDPETYLRENPSALVTDVATDPNGTVLEEATGRISTIYTVVPIEGKLRIAVGGVYSYYEFPWPMNDRLTDKKWWDIMDSEQAPDRPAWTELFMGNR